MGFRRFFLDAEIAADCLWAWFDVGDMSFMQYTPESEMLTAEGLAEVQAIRADKDKRARGIYLPGGMFRRSRRWWTVSDSYVVSVGDGIGARASS